MEYLFPHIEHKVYRNTFIQSTSVSLIGSNIGNELPTNFDKRCIEFAERFFQIKPDIENFLNTNVMIFSNDEEEVEFSFGPDKARLTIGRKNYVSFLNNIMPELLQLKEFMFGVMQNSSLENLCIRKLNLFPITAENDESVSENVDEIFKYFFNSELIDNVEDSIGSVPKNASWMLCFKKAMFAAETDPYEMSIRIGISKTNKEKRYNVILDSLARCKNTGEIKEGSVDRILLALNDRLFDAYHWCVNEGIISLMEKEDAKP